MPIQHAQINIKQRLLFGPQALGRSLGQVSHFLTYAHQRIIQAGDFRADIFHLTIRHGRQIRRREQQHAEADGRTRAAGQTIIKTGQVRPSRIQLIEQHPGGMGVGNHRRQLGGDSHQKGFFTLIETAHITLLHHHHPEHLAMMHHRHAEKGVKRIFAGFRQVMEFGMAEGIFQVHRLFAQAYLTHQAFRQPQTDMTHRFLLEAFGCHQHITLLFFVT